MKNKILFLMLGMFILIGSLGFTSAYNSSIGLVHNFTMDSSTYPFINSSSSSAWGNATSNFIKFGEDGISGNAIYWNTSGAYSTSKYVQLSFPLSTLESNDYSVTFWIKPDEYAEAGTSLFSAFGGASLSRRITVESNDSIKNVVNHDGDKIIYSNATVINNSWNYLVFIFSGGTRKMYLNGILVAYDENSYVPTTSPTGLTYLGGDLQGGNTPKGYMDELRFYNRTLNQSEITQYYQELIPPSSILVNLTTPLNNVVISTGNNSLNTSLSIIGTNYSYQWKNETINIWFSNGTLFKTNYTTLTGNSTTYNKTFSDFVSLKKYYWNAYACYDNSTFGNCTWATSNYTFSTYITINILENGVNKAEQIAVNCSSGDWATTKNILSPKITGLSVFTNGTNANVTCTFRDLQNYADSNTTTIWFNDWTPEYNITMASKSITLYFRNWNGTLMNTTGYWSNGTYNTGSFNSTSYVQILRTLETGHIRVMFGYNSTPMNYTQFYEYDNDWITNTIENITLLNITDPVEQYIKVVDESGNPINDVLVRASYSLPESGASDLYREMGQRFTGSDGTNGMTRFYFDDMSDALLRFSKDGYTTIERTVDIGIRSYTSSDPLTIVLYKGDITVYNGVQIRTWKSFDNNNTYIPISIYAPSRTSVTYTTSYRQTEGLGNDTIVLNEYKNGYTNLIRGTDYAGTGSDNIIITFWVDGEYWGQIGIDNTIKNTDKFNEPSGMDSDVKKGLLWIALLFLTGMFGLFIKGEDEGIGTGGFGKPIFFIGIILINILVPLGYIGLLVVTLLYFGLKIIKSFIDRT